MMRARNYLASLIFLAFGFGAQEAVAPVPVEKEPLHHVVLKNDSVMVMHLTLPAGERTLYHTHTHDRVAVNLSSTAITQQKLGEAEGAATTSTPGTFSAMTLEGNAYTHRVHNVGTSDFDVIDVELLERPRGTSAAADGGGGGCGESERADLQLGAGAGGDCRRCTRMCGLIWLWR